MSPELLYPIVSEAIRRAETLEDLGAPGASAAFLDVSLLEEKIAEGLPITDPEGAVARRGAVRAALTARDYGRARQLIERYLPDAEGDEGLRSELTAFARQIEDAASEKEAAARLQQLRLATEELLELLKSLDRGQRGMDQILWRQAEFVKESARLALRRNAGRSRFGGKGTSR